MIVNRIDFSKQLLIVDNSETIDHSNITTDKIIHT